MSVAVILPPVSDPRRTPDAPPVDVLAAHDAKLDFASLHDAHARLVHGIALAIVGPADADDAAQDAFVAIHRGLDGVRDKGTVASWVCQVARNACLDFLRRRHRRPEQTAGAALDDVPDPAPPGSGELAHRVLALIRNLPPAYRETLVLRLVEGLSGPEIARLTGMTAGSLRVNLCRGMAMLRPLLEKEGWP